MTSTRYYPTSDEVSDLCDTVEAHFGGFNAAYDRLPEFRAILRSARGSMGQADSYKALAQALAAARKAS